MGTFVTDQNLDQTVSLLSHTPKALDALLRDLPETWITRSEGEGTWSPFDVVGHLIDCEHINWIPRIEWILEKGEGEPFRPFDRSGHARETKGKTLGHLLDEFARLRLQNLSLLEELNLQPEDFERRGMHPSLGPVTLGNLVATWAAHDLTHLHQISRIMAYQYREAVGPWSRFLGVMKCSGHSEKA